MVFLSDFVVVVNAVNGVYFNLSVSHCQPEVAGFQFLEPGSVLNGLLTLFLLLFLPAQSVDLLHIFIVSLLEIGWADVLWGLDVFATTLLHLDVVYPHLRILDLVAVAVGYLDSIPIGVDVSLAGRSCTKVSEQFYLVGFHQRLCLGVGQQLLE